jgi:hypothetical protein
MEVVAFTFGRSMTKAVDAITSETYRKGCATLAVKADGKAFRASRIENSDE